MHSTCMYIGIMQFFSPLLTVPYNTKSLSDSAGQLIFIPQSGISLHHTTHHTSPPGGHIIYSAIYHAQLKALFSLILQIKWNYVRPENCLCLPYYASYQSELLIFSQLIVQAFKLFRTWPEAIIHQGDLITSSEYGWHQWCVYQGIIPTDVEEG